MNQHETTVYVQGPPGGVKGEKGEPGEPGKRVSVVTLVVFVKILNIHTCTRLSLFSHQPAPKS